MEQRRTDVYIDNNHTLILEKLGSMVFVFVFFKETTQILYYFLKFIFK